MNTIGVVAGAGPFAGLDLIKKIFEQTIASADQDHLPVIGWFRPDELPDRTAFLLNNRLPNPGTAIAKQVLALEKAGASVAAIPCNTAHAALIFDRMNSELAAQGSKIHFVNMLAETMQHIRKYHPELKRIAALSTTGTYRVSLYPDYLQNAGFQPVIPDETVQTQWVHTAIYDPHYGIKVTGCGTELARASLIDAVRHLKEKGAQAVILGCTELPLALTEKMIEGVPLLDPTLILARALIQAAAPEKLKAYSTN